MSHHRQLPVWKAAMDLAVHLEHAVRRFPRYHKYTLGTELRHTAQRLCQQVARANTPFIEFATATELTVGLGKQRGGWRRRVRSDATIVV